MMLALKVVNNNTITMVVAECLLPVPEAQVLLAPMRSLRTRKD